jgi:SAM-dependent methyltransferase
MADAIFEEHRLAELYDPLESDRPDLDLYVGLAEEFAARAVVDVGCGTGTFACLLAQRGMEVTGVDPAEASLDIARHKPGAHKVHWLMGDATALAPMQVDLVTMTGNVAQIFLTEDDWLTTLAAVRAVLRPGGRLAFESRDPAKQAWREWNRKGTYRRVDLPGLGTIATWVELTDVTLPLVSFRHTFVFESDGAVLTSDSTLRFRS